MRRCASSYSIIQGRLYRRGFSLTLLKCVEGDEYNYVLADIHEGTCGQHLSSNALPTKSLRAGYYWPTITEDARKFMKKCDKCQRHADFRIAPPTNLTFLSSSWPFTWWVTDLHESFPTAPSQVK